MKRIVHVEFDALGPVRIFRSETQALESDASWKGRVKLWPRARAVAAIRRRVFDRDEWRCVHCGCPLTWTTGDMHEKQPRGTFVKQPDGEYRGGEISLDNSALYCHNCHMADHGREIKWSSR